ncbi:unnamed protein product [Phytomonas sp. Hart1]|nr:unnamed protein product [Phytomonas sp. Hart1]|eukprot:CCW68903.1 unnamed protein product [Phytomonas sp. isolate Hart1]
MNSEFAIEKEILTANSFFCKVNYLYQPLHAETKEYLDSFFHKDGLINLCDQIFGHHHKSDFQDENPCWMDIANNSPNSSMASTLFRLLAPSTPFINLLDSFSLPSVDFSRKAKCSWKYENVKKSEEGHAKYTIDFPLSTLYPNSFSLLGEPNNVSLYNMTRSKCPPLLLVPFWVPPLVTRKEASSNQIMTSLPCLPLPYFILRMFCYSMRRCEKHGNEIISSRFVGIVGWMHRLHENLNSIFYQKASIEFPFYHRVLTAFIQYYTTPSLFRNLSSKIVFEETMWTSADAIAALLICSPVLFSNRNISQSIVECRRNPIYDSSIVAQLLCTSPFLTEIFNTMYINCDSKNRNTFALQRTEFSNDTLSKSVNDIIYIYLSFYRNCLIILRECLLSLDGFPNVNFVHLNNLLELWLTLMNPLSRKGNFVDDHYILCHFEAYTCITLDVLKLFTKGSLIKTLDRTGVSLFSRCLQILSTENFKQLISTFEREPITENTHLLNIFFKNCVLNWVEDQDVVLQMANFKSDKISSIAAHVYALLEQKSATCKQNGMEEDIRICLTYIEHIFPESKLLIDKWRGFLNSVVPENIYVDSSPSFFQNVSAAHILSESDKNSFFKGLKHRRVVCSDHIRFPTKNRKNNGDYLLFNITMRQEFPLIIGFTIYLDTFLNKLTETIFSNWIPKCENGHDLWLICSRNFSCCNHSSEIAIWECRICVKTYGICCRSEPIVTIKGERLQLANAPSQTKLCSWCGEVSNPNENFFISNKQDTIFLCSGCASRPFKPWCTRWMAAYKTWSFFFIIIPFILVMWAL